MIYANDRLEGMTKYKVNKIKDKVMAKVIIEVKVEG
jgi:hypothetical protein